MAATGAKTEDPPKTPDIKKEAKDDSFGFECNICLTAAQKPVVTLCGHLYCWPCLYKWLNHSKKGECPVCKGGVTTNNVIPIYGRGRHSDPRKSTLSVPERPRAHRSASSPTHVEARSIARSIHLPIRSDAGGMSAGFGLFPSLFGSNTAGRVELDAIRGGNGNGNYYTDFLREEQQEQLSRMLLVLGSLVILCLLMF
mmetsp:Transcript_16917/g.34240  ORF Transcript_16917/g.34240 Transcript_16917/m.34240 type:complete len:198 (-) Transcript_16917:293-886(-)